jgi:adenylate cyclase class IV
MIEFEVKSSLKETKELVSLLQTMENKGEKNIIDVYYDTPEAVFFQK